MNPKEQDRISVSVGESLLGRVMVASTPRGVCAVFLGEDDAALDGQLRMQFPQAQIASADAAANDHLSAVLKSLEGNSDPTPIDSQGTPFQERVWQALKQIPRGATRSYSELAREIGSPKAVRAVAGACAKNNIAVLIPCHRVIRENGDLGGYRWGIERKRRLLQEELAR